MSFAKHARPGSNRRKKTLELHATESRHSRTSNGAVVTGIISVLIALIVGIAFGQAFGNDFVGYDDQRYVVQNPWVTNGLTLDGIQWAFTHVHASNWHPLTTISHMLDCQLYGLEPWGHHLTSILLHAAGAILLLFALRELTCDSYAVAGIYDAGRDERSQLQREGPFWASAFVAALFAVHPLRVESVAWVSERKDVLSGVFFTLILWAYARYARGNSACSFWYITVVVLFALGLMCKPTLVTVPFVLLLLDYWPLGRTQSSPFLGRGITRYKWSWLIVEKLPLIVISAASCVATFLAQKQALDTSLKPPLDERIGNTLVSYVVYLGQMLWPARLAVLYPYPERNLKVPHVILALLLLLIISIAVFLWRKKYPFLLIGWLWYLGMLVPMIGIIQVGSQARADRYTYLPQIGLYLLVAWSAMELFLQCRRSRMILAVAGFLIITALITRSYFQTSYWLNTETLWKHAIATTSNNYIATNNLAQFLFQSGRFDEGITECQRALKIKPDFAAAHNNLGAALVENRQRRNDAGAQNAAVDEAIAHYRRALQINPDFAQGHSNLGTALLLKRQTDEAIAQYQKALEIDPNFAEARYSLGNAFLAEGRYSESIAEYEAALRTRPDYFEAHYNLGRALATIGKTDEALKEFTEALRINEDSAQVHCALGTLLGRMGRRQEAVAHLTEALRLNPNYENAKQQLRKLDVPGPQ
jgi:tetratricopeptide (TPR) repeat protein